MTVAQPSPIVVRRAEARDADAMAATFAMPGAMAGTLQLPYPTAATYAKWIDDVASGDVAHSGVREPGLPMGAVAGAATDVSRRLKNVCPHRAR